MHYGVRLDLDADAQAVLRAIDRRLEAVGCDETIVALGNVHHLSLAVYDRLPGAGFEERLARFADAARTLPITLSSVAAFPGEQSVLHLAPVPGAALIELHRRYHDAFRNADAACWDHYRPGRWMPHVTLAMNVAPDVLGRAVAEVGQNPWPLEARLDHLTLIEAPPVRILARHALALSSAADSV